MIATFKMIWRILFVVVITVEAIALGIHGTGGTLSAQVWSLYSLTWMHFLLWPLWIWLTYHFYLQSSVDHGTVSRRDVLALAVGVLIAIVSLRR